jgi:hypothetical protein
LPPEQAQQFPACGRDRLLGDDEELPFGHAVERNAGRKPAFRGYPAAVPPTVMLSIRSVG